MRRMPRKIPLRHSKERIPKLEDVLRLVQGSVPLIIEFKVDGTDLSICPVAEELLCGYGGLDH